MWGKEFLLKQNTEDGIQNVCTYSPHSLFQDPLFCKVETLELP